MLSTLPNADAFDFALRQTPHNANESMSYHRQIEIAGTEIRVRARKFFVDDAIDNDELFGSHSKAEQSSKGASAEEERNGGETAAEASSSSLRFVIPKQEKPDLPVLPVVGMHGDGSAASPFSYARGAGGHAVNHIGNGMNHGKGHGPSHAALQAQLADMMNRLPEMSITGTPSPVSSPHPQQMTIGAAVPTSPIPGFVRIPPSPQPRGGSAAQVEENEAQELKFLDELEFPPRGSNAPPPIVRNSST